MEEGFRESERERWRDIELIGEAAMWASGRVSVFCLLWFVLQTSVC